MAGMGGITSLMMACVTTLGGPAALSTAAVPTPSVRLPMATTIDKGVTYGNSFVVYTYVCPFFYPAAAFSKRLNIVEGCAGGKGERAKKKWGLIHSL